MKAREDGIKFKIEILFNVVGNETSRDSAQPYQMIENNGTYPDLIWRDGMVGVRTENVHRQRMTLADLGGQQESAASQQLQVVAIDRACAEESIEEVYRQWESLLLALLLVAYLAKHRVKQLLESPISKPTQIQRDQHSPPASKW